MPTLIIEWEDRPASEGGGTVLRAKVGKNAQAFWEESYPKGQLERARDRAVELLNEALPKFEDVEATPRAKV